MKKQALKKEYSKEELDNRSKQLNPNNIEYLKSRGIEKPRINKMKNN